MHERLIPTLHASLMGQFSTGHRAANVIIPGWYECDIVRVTDSDWWDEVEIKCSVSDFKADAAKARLAYIRGRGRVREGATKHEQLAAGDERGPNRFWFALRADVAAKVQVPKWAGVLTWERSSDGGRIRSIQRAPVLHRKPNGAEVREHLLRSVYFRYAGEFERYRPLRLLNGEGI